MIIEVVSLDLEVRSRIIHLSSMVSFIHEFKENYSTFCLECVVCCTMCVFSPECREGPMLWLPLPYTWERALQLGGLFFLGPGPKPMQ
jgi:hypothetical protein